MTLGTAPPGGTAPAPPAEGTAPAPPAEGTAPVADGATVWRLRDEEQFLVRSLEDAEREREAGDLSEEDFGLLVARDRARLAEVRRLLAEASSEPLRPKPVGDGDRVGRATAPAKPRRRRWWLAAMGVVLVVAGLVLLVLDLVSPRLPGQTATGGVSLNADQKVERQLAQAAVLVEQHKLQSALRVYDTVLTEDPRQPEALAQWGWLEWGIGERTHDAKLAQAGGAFVDEALRVDPRFTAAHLYLGTIDEAGGDDAAAAVQYGQFLAAHPPAVLVRDSRLVIEKAYQALGRPVPPVVSGDSRSGPPTSTKGGSTPTG